MSRYFLNKIIYRHLKIHRVEFKGIPPIVNDAIEIGAKVVWMQLGLVHNESARKAQIKGLKVVMNKCIKIEYMRNFKEEQSFYE